MQRNTAFTALLSMIALGALVVCGCNLFPPKNAQPKTTGKVRVTGILSSARTVAAQPNGGRTPRALGSVPVVAAVPLLSPSLDSNMLDNEQEFPLNSDGSFDISLSTSSPWLLALKNGNASDPRDIYQGVIAVADQSNSLIYLPLDQATSDVDLSTIVQSSDEYVSQVGMSAFSAYFDCPLQDMQLLARLDSMGKFIKNYYTNCDPSAQAQYDLNLSYWYLSRDPIENGVYLTPAQFVRFRYLPWIWVSGSTPFTVDQLIHGETTLALKPPEGSVAWDQAGAVSYTPAQPIAATGSYGTHDLYGRTDYWFAGGLTVSVSSSTGAVDAISANLGGQMPLGTWTLVQGSTELGWFDVTSVRDTDDAGHFAILVPLPKFTFDAQGLLQSVEIKLVYYDSNSGSYVELPDYGVVSSLIGRFSCTLRDYDANAGPSGFYEEWLVNDNSGSVLTNGRLTLNPSQYKWTRVDNSSDQTRTIDEFDLQYRFGAADFDFQIRTDGGQ